MAEQTQYPNIRESQGLRASLAHCDGPFIPEPGGPRVSPAASQPG